MTTLIERQEILIKEGGLIRGVNKKILLICGVIRKSHGRRVRGQGLKKKRTAE
jgi:hypothetical protein